MTSRVMVGCAIHSHRQGDRPTRMTPIATTTAHPKCRLGIAANWFATLSVSGAFWYTVGP